ncbi:MAG: hypothetical protein LBS84_04815 [Clostridiales bacterium]|jgi:hypothetical protein|nr:hypothetical protein [Clostridiales bacterium]
MEDLAGTEGFMVAAVFMGTEDTEGRRWATEDTSDRLWDIDGRPWGMGTMGTEDFTAVICAADTVPAVSDA